jgi:hypothetical protein
MSSRVAKNHAVTFLLEEASGHLARYGEAIQCLSIGALLPFIHIQVTDFTLTRVTLNVALVL